MNIRIVFVGLMFLWTSFFSLSASALPLQDGNFTDFTGWEAVIFDGTDSIVDPTIDPHFTLVGGSTAELSNDSTFFEVALFQTFDLPINAGELSFNFAWSVTNATLPTGPLDPDADLVQATLIDSITFNFLTDLFPLSVDFSLTDNIGLAMTDVRPWAGQSVMIEFLLLDGDFNEQDFFRVGDIAISQIPAPGTLMLMLGGLLYLCRYRSRWN